MGITPCGFFFSFSFLAVWSHHCWEQAFSSCSEQELLFAGIHGLMAVASLVAEHRLIVAACGLSSCDAQGLVAPQHVGSSQSKD